MSDVVTNRQPSIGFGERRPCPPSLTDQKVGDLLAELLRIISDEGEPDKSGFQSKFQLSAEVRRDAAQPGDRKQLCAQVRQACGDFAAIGLVGKSEPKAPALPRAEGSQVENTRPNRPAPFIGGDFATIEAGLLGAPHELDTATISESGSSKAFASVTAGSEGRLYRENQLASRRDRLAEGQKRTRRSPRVVAVIAFAGMASSAAIFGLNGWRSETGNASIRSDNGPYERETLRVADVPAQDAPILSKVIEPSSRVLVTDNERTVDAAQVEEKTPPADSQAQPDNGPAPVLEVPAQAPMPAQPQSTAAPESNTVKADVVPSDGAFPPGGATPQANISEALPAPQSPAATEAPAANTAERVAMPQKPVAAKHRKHRGTLHQTANKLKPAQRSPLPPEPTSGTGPDAQSPTMQPSPASDGAFGFLQNAVNSLTSATAKLFGGTN
ncbi:MAG TPA: hypothetical protein VKE72_00930 [Methylocella sp.]|nr:hypothetical protein [Methylocella sp.]